MNMVIMPRTGRNAGNVRHCEMYEWNAVATPDGQS